MDDKKEIYEQVKAQNPIVDTIEQLWDCNVRGGKIMHQPCPFCASSDAFCATDVGKHAGTFHCFSCGESGDVISFVQKIKGYKHAKEACEALGGDFKIDENQRQELRKKREQKRIEQEKIENEKKAKARIAMTEKFQELKFFKVNHWDYFLSKVTEVFPHFEKMPPILKQFIVYDTEHESVVIATENENKEICNLKYRTKKGFDGKWISYPNCTQYPFLKHIGKTDSNKIYITEGEKDALYLQSIGLYAITLGGVTIGFSQYESLLKDKTIYLCFDDDEAGYKGILKHYNDIKNIARKVYCLPLVFQEKPSGKKGYDISDLFVSHEILLHEKPSELFSQLTQYDYFVMNAQTQNFIAQLANADKNFRERVAVPNLEINLTKFIQDSWGNHVQTILSAERRDFIQILDDLKGYIAENIADESVKKEILNSRVLNPKKSEITRMLQVGERDRAKAFESMTLESNAPIKIYQNNAFVFNGSYYSQISANGDFVPEVKNFVTKWQDLAYDKEKSKTTMQYMNLVRDLHTYSEQIPTQNSDHSRNYVFLNGILKVYPNGQTQFRKEFNQEVFETSQLPYEYNPHNKPHKFLKAVKELIEPDDILTLQEFMGYCLSATHSYECFMLFFGVGNSGKSVIANLLRSFFAENKVSSVPAHSLKDPYLSSLSDKHLNVGGEINANAIDTTCVENIKLLCSNTDSVAINGKYERISEIHYQHKPKMIFTCNTLPKIGTLDSGFFRRLLVIEFKKSIPKEKIIRDMTRRFLDEKPALFNWALEGLKRLSLQNGFTISNNSQILLNEYKEREDIMGLFIEECIVITKEAFQPLKDVYLAYEKYCEESNFRPLAINRFKDAFLRYCRGKGYDVKTTRPNNRVVFNGIGLRHEQQ